MNQIIYKIGIIGPTRVGKTSLLTALLADSKELLRNQPVSIEAPPGSPTARKIANNNQDLQGSIFAGELDFNSNAIKGTEQSTEFEFELKHKFNPNDFSVKLKFLDYPGGWIDETHRTSDQQQFWNKCQQFIEESPMLIIPIDATIIMETKDVRHKKVIPYLLALESVKNASENWAKARSQRKQEPAILFICPIKCETYTKDHTKQRELYEKIKEIYKDILDTIKREHNNIEIIYNPIDTIGCIAVQHTVWTPNIKIPGGYEVDVHYILTGKSRQVAGAKSLLINICKTFVDISNNVNLKKYQQSQNHLYQAINNQKQLNNRAEEDNGWLGNIWWWISGERKERRDMADAHQKNVSIIQEENNILHNQTKTLAEVIQSLANTPVESRVIKGM